MFQFRISPNSSLMLVLWLWLQISQPK